ncbi:hypothetical protein EJ04DRAFT_479110 [Polyplosphaeria fusca]|uniref:Uncharacterized protein n=1 Tax=Polyplosphaeria fusca TaxID=682080 RepID=A0A9P4UUP4_9PLEO|nr:hypothetical protein EJ04DRAFT_479110 [Polyplosphaeria fusca]
MTIVNMGREAVPSRALPHTPEAGDPYYIGDCYDRSDVPSEWEVDAREMPYLMHIKVLSESWKPLRYLADFMEVGTTPLRWKDFKAGFKDERQERVQRTEVTYLKYSHSGKATSMPLKTADALRACVSNLTSLPSDSGSTHVLVVEDLSRDTIEILGSAFDIDPFFFREQIDEYSWYNTRDPWANPPGLTAAMRSRNWLRIRNIRLHHFGSKGEFKEAQQQSNSFNVLRRPDDDQNHWHYMDKPGSIVSLTRTKTSIWTGNTGKDGDISIGIVLVDPTITAGTPLWYGHSNWQPPPSMHAEGATTTPPTSPSLYNEILNKTSSYPWFMPRLQNPSSSKGIIAKPAMYAAAAEWLIVCDYMKARLGQIEWELEKPGTFRSRGDVIDASLHRLHVWRRVIPVYREMVTETLEQAVPAAARLLPLAPPVPNLIETLTGAFEDIAQDFRRVQNALNELQARVDRLTSIVTAEISIEDSRRGLQENHNLARLTWMATTFIPLSFVTGLFSMQNNIADMRETFGWYFLTALPLTIAVLVGANRVGRGWRLRKKANGGDKKSKKSE